MFAVFDVFDLFEHICVGIGWEHAYFYDGFRFNSEFKRQFIDSDGGKFISVIDFKLYIIPILLPLTAFSTFHFSTPDPGSFRKPGNVPFDVADMQVDGLVGSGVIFDFEVEPALMAMGVGIVFEVDLVLVLGELGNKLEVGLLEISKKLYIFLLGVA